MRKNGRRAQIEQNLKNVKHQIRILEARQGQRLGYGNDEADQGSDLAERANMMAVLRILRGKRWQLEHAMRNVSGADGDRCEVCGMPIHPARLQVLAEVTRCIDCQKQMEERAFT
jgi:RNA polymerase-binding transcription factor DksA